MNDPMSEAGLGVPYDEPKYVEPWGTDKQLGWVVPALVAGFDIFCVAIVVGAGVTMHNV